MEDNQFIPQPQQVQISAEEAAEVQARFFAQVYGWMAAGLGLTGGIAMFASTSPALISFVFGTRFVFLGLIIAELVIVGFLSARVEGRFNQLAGGLVRWIQPLVDEGFG